MTLRPGERLSRGSVRTHDIQAHDDFLRGRELLLGTTKNRDVFEHAVALFRHAIELDPDYAEPFAGLAMAYVLDFQNHWTNRHDALDLATHFARRALERGPNEAYVHTVAAVVAFWRRDLTQARAEADAALALNPNQAQASATRGQVEIYCGNPLAAIPFIEQAILLDPIFAQQYIHFLGSARLVAGQFEAAVETFRERVRLAPDTDLSRAFLACALGHLGRLEEARQVWSELKQVNPKYSFAEHLARLPFENGTDLDRLKEGLDKAGLPD